MKDKITKYISFRDMPFALAYSTIAFVVLWAAKYPADERLGIVIIAYIALWLSKLVIGYAMVALLRTLRNYGLRTAERAGIDVSDAGQARTRGANVVAVVFLLMVMATILGCSLVPTTYIATAYGLTPLNPYFATIGWTMLIAGVSALTLFFALSLALFKSVGSVEPTGTLKPNTLNSRIIRINQSETLVQRLAA